LHARLIAVLAAENSGTSQWGGSKREISRLRIPYVLSPLSEPKMRDGRGHADSMLISTPVAL